MMSPKLENERPVAPGPALEQRVAPEHVAVGVEEAHAAGTVPGRVQHAQAGAGHDQLVAVVQLGIGFGRFVHDVPEHPVRGMEQHRRVDQLAQRDRRR